MTSAAAPFADVAVVGGGAAGLSAALTLGRACRSVVLVSAGPPRNAAAPKATGLFSRDGARPEDLVEIGRAQLEPYDVDVRDAEVTDLEGENGAFVLTLDGGAAGHVRARKVVLATGVRDRLPEIPGARGLWGTSVFSCPYCHGWEVAGRPIGVMGNGAVGAALAKRLLGWSRDLVLFTDGPSTLTPEQRDGLDANGVVVCEAPVRALTAGPDGRLATVVLDGAAPVARDALFLEAESVPADALAVGLGCSQTDDGRVEVGRFGYTSVRGLFVAGDLGPAMRQLATAAASGVQAAFAVNYELLDEAFAAGAVHLAAS